MGYLIHLSFFQADIKVPIVLISQTLVHFFQFILFFLLHNPCLFLCI
jgi:hypothetical protein